MRRPLSCLLRSPCETIKILIANCAIKKNKRLSSCWIIAVETQAIFIVASHICSLYKSEWDYPRPSAESIRARLSFRSDLYFLDKCAAGGVVQVAIYSAAFIFFFFYLRDVYSTEFTTTVCWPINEFRDFGDYTERGG